MAVDVFVVSFIFVSAFIPLVQLIVPPKTPVLSGFEPAAVASHRELVCDASQPDAGTITYRWYKYKVDARTGVEDWERMGPIGTSQKYIFHSVSEKKVFHAGNNEEPVSGKYKCRASNSAGTRESEWGDLYVFKPCLVRCVSRTCDSCDCVDNKKRTFPSCVTSSIGSLYTVSVSPAKSAIGGTFTLTCYIPNPSGMSVFWSKRTEASSQAIDVAVANNKACQASNYTRYNWSSCSPPSILSPTKTFNLQVTNAQPSASGYWICQDIGLSCNSNPVKSVVQAIPGIPHITGFPSGPVIVGSQLNLKCVASPAGDTYDWYKDGTKVTTSLSYDFQVTKDSASVYSCVARNAVGSTTSRNGTLVVYSAKNAPTISITRNGRLVTVLFSQLIKGYTGFQLKFCEPGQTPKTAGCEAIRFTLQGQTKLTYTAIVTHETTIYVFYLDLYIGDDVVDSSGPVLPELAGKTTSVPAGSSINAGMIAAVVAAGVTAVVVVVVVVLLHSRRMACFAGQNKPEESNQDAERTGTTKPVSVCDQPSYKDVVYSALEGEDTQPEPVYLNYPQQDSVKEVIYDNPKVIEKPSGEDTPRKVEDMSVHDFKQWLLSNRVTESTYECLARNGFNYQGFFFMLQQQDLDKMKIEPLAQEALIRKLVRDFNGIRQSESCEGKKPRCPTAGEDNPYVEMENQNGAFYILPDVTANQTYMASRVSNN